MNSKALENTIEETLESINTGLVARGEFLEALRQLMLLAVDHVDNHQLWLLVGLVYTRLAYWRPAIEALETALKLNPKDNQAKQLLALALFSIGQKDHACMLIDKVCCSSKDANSAQWMLRAYIHAHTSSDPMRALHTARDWGRRFADPLTRRAKPLKVRNRDPRKKLKIGYVTADFRQHSVAFFMQPVLAHHNSEQFEIHVYFNGYSDEVTARMRALVPHWTDVMDMSDEAMCQLIRQDEIDVLVDLSGFTQGHRLGVFARRAAPVQVTWLGYLLPLGMKAMDYRLVSRSSAPLSHADYYTETLFHLPGMACYQPPSYAPLCKDPPLLRNGYPTLISLNSSGKITDRMLLVWAKILDYRKDARLIILVKEENADAAQAHMQPRVQAAGLPLDRVSVLHQQPLNNFMELGYIADIALDTSPISGGTTTLHSIWMGLPIVTLDAVRGVDACTARMLSGILKPCGRIAVNEDDYIKHALDLMSDVDYLIETRSISRDLLKKSGFMNYGKRTIQIERSFRGMWINYLLGKKEILDVSVNFTDVLKKHGI